MPVLPQKNRYGKGGTMRSLKFRAWDKKRKRYGEVVEIEYNESREIDGIWVWYNIHERYEPIPGANVTVEQYTGLKDKNGKEIYENCELDGRYRVEYIAPKFVGKDMVKGDIIELYDNKFTITKEHCEISQNSERGTN